MTIVVASVLLGATRTFASPFSCFDSFRVLAGRLRAIQPASLATDETENVHPAVRRWLDGRKRTFTAAPWFPKKKIGQVFMVGGIRCETIAALGGGREGVVYLVRTAEGLRTVKFFTNRSVMDSNLEALSAVHDIRKPRIFARIPKMNAVLFEYLEGVPVEDIDASGISPADIDEIRTRWTAYQISRQVVLNPDNFIYSFRDDDFQMIDVR